MDGYRVVSLGAHVLRAARIKCDARSSADATKTLCYLLRWQLRAHAKTLPRGTHDVGEISSSAGSSDPPTNEGLGEVVSIVFSSDSSGGTGLEYTIDVSTNPAQGIGIPMMKECGVFKKNTHLNLRSLARTPPLNTFGKAWQKQQPTNYPSGTTRLIIRDMDPAVVWTTKTLTQTPSRGVLERTINGFSVYFASLTPHLAMIF
ncbi:hypothetical protein BDZ94DRAFT_1234576 [Collybia nuda]|uniref:Uncharacterized protein n=1 Tax=Collybia nuda TaxID=64659 RepID=A0A9P6CLZ3_9AGAR|nr:hypothetical protein BDZ94DRAFT_1234576 [Collybia nuda]